MRHFTIIASFVFFASTGSALAADCGRGMLWPYVRNPGDCLTDAELKAGQTGVYNGPVNTNVDVGAIKPDPAAQNAPTSSVTGALLENVFGGDSAPANSGRSTVSCNKGYLWPFVREPGDCLTAVERKTDKNGVYGGVAAATQVSATNAGQANTPAGGTQASAPAPSTNTAAACRKGWLWPFVRDAGDCPTDAEKK